MEVCRLVALVKLNSHSSRTPRPAKFKQTYCHCQRICIFIQIVWRAYPFCGRVATVAQRQRPPSTMAYLRGWTCVHWEWWQWQRQSLSQSHHNNAQKRYNWRRSGVQKTRAESDFASWRRPCFRLAVLPDWQF